MKLYFCYILLMSIITFFLMFSDKRRAMCHRRRIPEKVLFLFAFLGGAFGGLCVCFFADIKPDIFPFVFYYRCFSFFTVSFLCYCFKEAAFESICPCGSASFP